MFYCNKIISRSDYFLHRTSLKRRYMEYECQNNVSYRPRVLSFGFYSRTTDQNEILLPPEQETDDKHRKTLFRWHELHACLCLCVIPFCACICFVPLVYLNLGFSHPFSLQQKVEKDCLKASSYSPLNQQKSYPNKQGTRTLTTGNAVWFKRPLIASCLSLFFG